jgi:uncharacterized membrane protein YoaK (UPF0700 family)
LDQRKLWLAVCLTWTAGLVDAVGYIALYHIYTANMSGNSIAFGASGAGWNWYRAFERGTPIFFFFLGLCLCGFLLEWSRRRRRRAPLARLLALEAACLVAFALLAGRFLSLHPNGSIDYPWLFLLLIALAAGAMGLQNASLTHVGPLSIHTTHVTGTLLTCAQHLVRYGFWFGDHARGHSTRRLARLLRLSPRQQSWRDAMFLAGLWVGYVAGAVVGTILLHYIGLAALAAPVGVLAVFLIMDLRRPFILDPPPPHPAHPANFGEATNRSRRL